MHFEAGHIYHVYNQGNNRQMIFFNKENYFFFLKKIRTHILPYTDILAWCLMPNHFHLMVYVRNIERVISQSFISSETLTNEALIKRSLNDSIGLLLRSYTRAINKQEDRSGSLFRKVTKAECITAMQGIVPSFCNTHFGTLVHTHLSEKEYPQVCFNYIHANPVVAKLVKQPEDWEFSSFRDYAGLRNGSLVNSDKAKEYLDIGVNNSGLHSK